MHREESPEGERHRRSSGARAVPRQGPPPPIPPRWTTEKMHSTGDVVWHRGSYWRCEADLTESEAAPPDSAMHLWTPIHSITTYSTSTVPELPMLGHKPDPPIQEPRPRRGTGASISAPSAPPPGLLQNQIDMHLEHDDSPDSQSTVRASKQYGEGKSSHASSSTSSSSGDATAIEDDTRERPGIAAFFAAKADEGLRYLAAKQERARIGGLLAGGCGAEAAMGELRAEIRGEKSWRTGGVGVWSFDADAEVERAKQKVWVEEGEKRGRQGWLDAAAKRTEMYKGGVGVKPLIQWHLHAPSTNPHFPPSAIPIGYEGNGVPLFAARAWYGGGLHLGKAGPHLYHGASISYGGAEITLDTFEVLCAPGSSEAASGQDGAQGLLKWMMFRHGESCGVEGWQPVEGGREATGEPLLVAKGDWEGGQHPGKCRMGDDHAHVPWGGGEVWVRPFQVLAYASSSRR